MAERVGFEPTVRMTVQWLSSSKILVFGLCHAVAKRALWFAILTPMILACDVGCYVPCCVVGLQFGLQVQFLLRNLAADHMADF
jgi:hypothetical protein